MTNSKAIRNLVGKLVNLHPSEIILSDEPINPEFIPQDNCGHSWWDGAEIDRYEVWGISLSSAHAIPLDIRSEYSYSINGVESYSEGETLAKYLAREKESYEMFLVHNWGKEYGEDGREFEHYTLYKSPNFPEYWKQVDEKDLERWEKWLKEI